jgi:hypothetical protein
MLKQLSLNNCSSPTCYILNQECIFDQAIIIKQETDWSPNYSERRKFTRSFRSRGGEREREREREREGEGIRVSPAPAAWRGSSVWTRCGMRMAPAWRGAAGIGCGQHRPGLYLWSRSHLHRWHGGGPRYGTDAVCGWRRLGGELSASAADSVGLD